MHVEPQTAVSGPAPELPPVIGFGDGFWPGETTDNGETFRWMSQSGSLSFPPSGDRRFLELAVSCEFADCSQHLMLESGAQLSLPPGPSNVSIEIPAHTSRLDLTADPIIPLGWHAGDPRPLAVCIRSARLHASAERHAAIDRQLHNSVLNTREMLEGRAHLRSTPRVLGIDLYGACNVKPPCVYCEWDWNKKLEGGFVDVPFDEHTLRELGPLYQNSASLVNCSIGEPFMMKNIDELLDSFADSGKALDMTSNGQILTDRNIERLIGRDIDLYVSLDAASAETYAKLRNNRFPMLVANLKRLAAAKGGPGRLPRLNLVFMPMKANQHELDDFVALAREINADRLVLRPLNFSDTLDMTWKRAGYEFDYHRELLPFERLIWLSGRARALCDRAGLALSDQLDFGGALDGAFAQQYQTGLHSVDAAVRAPVSAEDVAVAPVAPVDTINAAASAPEIAAAETAPSVEPAPRPEHPAPLCTEPWKSLYVLRRGVFPCCYGGQPLARMDEAASMWNSRKIEAIRADLASGRFPGYCLDSPACPIVRKHEQAGDLSGIAAFRLRAHRVIAKVQWATQWSRIRLKRIVTEPAYVKTHVSRLFRANRSDS